MTRSPSRQQLLEHLVASHICGDVETPRQSNLRNARLCAQGDPEYTFGLDLGGRWTFERIVALMAERVWTSPDLAHPAGPDRIDPYLCVERLDAMGDRLARAARDRERVLLATGHPAGLLPVYLAVGEALRGAGATLLQPAAGAPYNYNEEDRSWHVRHVGGVAMASSGGGLAHTHSPRPMRVMLAALDGQRPDLVVGDHGFAGAAGQAGVDSVGFADCNDPALFVGEAEGRVDVAVPLDDNVLPQLYAPVTAYLLACAAGRPAPAR